MIKILVLVVLLGLASCQTVHVKQYNDDGTLVLEYDREGLPNFSEGKQFSLEVHGL